MTALSVLLIGFAFGFVIGLVAMFFAWMFSKSCQNATIDQANAIIELAERGVIRQKHYKDDVK